MALRISWSINEAVVLLDALLSILNGEKTRKETIVQVSKMLRDYAVKNGVQIDDKFRNENGISLQLSLMEYYFTGGKSGLGQGRKCSKSFSEAIALYRSDKDKFNAILKEVSNINNSVQKDETNKIVDFTVSQTYSFTVPIKFDYFGDVHTVKSWKELYIGVLKCLFEDYPDIFRKLKNKPIGDNRVPIIYGKLDSSCLYIPKMIGENLYVETNRKTDHFIRCIRILLDLCKVDYENLVIEYNNESDSMEDEILELKYDNDKIELSSTPTSAVYYNRNIPDIKSWIGLYVKFMQIIWLEKSVTLKSYFGKSFWLNGRIDICDAPYKFLLQKPMRISKDVFIETELSNQEVVDRLKKVLDILNIPTKRLKITYKQPKTKNIDPNPENPPSAAEDVSVKQEKKVNSELIKKSRAVILEYFVNGIKKELQNEIGRPTIAGRQFIRFYSEKYNEDFPEDVNMEEVISSFALLYEGKYYAFSDETVSFVENYIKQLMNSHHVFFYSVLYQNLSLELTEHKIYSDNMLCMLIKSIFPDCKYKKNYFTDKNIGLEEMILELFSQHGALDFEQISELLPYVDMSVVRQICSRRTELIRIGEGKYTLTESIEFDGNDVVNSGMTIQKSIKEKKYCLTKALAVEKSTRLNENISPCTLQTVLFDKYFSHQYTRAGRLISAKNELISIDILLKDYCLSHKHITLEELENYELDITESDKRYSLKTANKYMIRTDAENFVSKGEIEFDVAAVDEKIALFCNFPVISLSDINSFNLFPYVEGFAWNSFLLASYLRHYSKKWKFEGIDGRNDVVGAIVKADMQYKDYDELLMIAVAVSDIELDENEVDKFLVRRGFRMRKTDVSSIISGAYRIREKSE